MLLRHLLLGAFFLASTFPLLLAPATIKFSDGSRIVGEIVHQSEGLYTIQKQNDTQVQIRVCDVVRIKNGGDDKSTLSTPVYQPVLRFEGSNTIGEKLMPAIAEAFIADRTGGESHWESGVKENEKSLKIGNTTNCVPKEITIKAHGSSTAFRALAAREADIGMFSRPIKTEEIGELATLSDLVHPVSEHVVALDGVAVVVHPNNPIQALTKREIAAIFAGEITDWSDVGGNPGSINVYARDENSGTFDTFRTLVLKNHDHSLSLTAVRFKSNRELSEKVASDHNGIGFVGLAYIGQCKYIAIDECGLLYSPSMYTVKTEEYPLARRLFLYTLATPRSLFVKDLIRFAVSDEGQDVVKNSGFIDLTIEPRTEIDEAHSRLSRMRSAMRNVQNLRVLKDFLDITEGATRLSVTFRFASGSAKLDRCALRDIKRLADFMKGQEEKRQRLMLLGFADARGKYHQNLSLSKARAESIANQLMWSGIRGPLTRGFGEEAPIACSDNVSSHKKNRRVEVWVK